MDIKKLYKMSSVFFIMGIYYSLMLFFSDSFSRLILQSYFFGVLFWGFIFLQILWSLLSILLLMILFRDEIIKTLKNIKTEQIILILCITVLFIPWNVFYKIITLYVVYLLLEGIKFFTDRENNISTVIILLNIVTGIFLLIMTYMNSLY